MIRQSEYNPGLSLEEAEERYNEVKGKFERVKTNYSGALWKFRIGRFRKNIKEEDKQTLADCVGVLLPLMRAPSVQEQARKSENSEETLHYLASQLNWQILDYLADFRNSGIERIE